MNAKQSQTNPLSDIPHSARGHFVLNFYAAVLHFLEFVRPPRRRCCFLSGKQRRKGLEHAFEKYPFLKEYEKEIRRYLPAELYGRKAIRWMEKQIGDWEQACKEHLPLLALSRIDIDGFGFVHRIALMVVGLVEEDSRFGTVIAELQSPLPHRRPCLDLVGQIMKNGSPDILKDMGNLVRSLIKAGLITPVNQDAPQSEWVMRAPAMLWRVIRGETVLKPASWCNYHIREEFPEIKELIFQQSFMDRLARMPELFENGSANTFILRSSKGGDGFRIMGAVARKLGKNILAVDDLVRDGEKQWEHLNPLCIMTVSMPVLAYDLGPGETADAPIIAGYEGPYGILMGFEGGLRGSIVEKAISLSIPMLKSSHRLKWWEQAFAQSPVKGLQAISQRFLLPAGYIRRLAPMAIAHAALDKGGPVKIDHVRTACRSLNRQLLDTLANRLQTQGLEGQLVVNRTTEAKLLELEQRSLNREKLMGQLGPGFGSECNTGVRALFTGPSGTGKTMAAKIFSEKLGMDLYRVDLAAVINKYIGETEKNLHQVLSRAEELDVVLLLDEGDALLGKRTEVKSANDRYANLETDYLLQKLETYQGIILVTTNIGENIDAAFQRRMDVVVNFIPPQIPERRKIWQIHLPPNHGVDFEFMETVIVRCPMTGGQIRNAALQAALTALDDGSERVERKHLEEAVRNEYRKAGAVYPLAQNKSIIRDQNGAGKFMDTLRAIYG